MANAMETVRVTASVSDGYDGLIRMAVDAQRFGFRLRTVTAFAEGDGTTVSMTLLMPPDVDCAKVCARLQRHPTMLSVHAAVVDVDDEPDNKLAVPPLEAAA